MTRVATEATLHALDFPLLLAELAGNAQTPMGRGHLEVLTPIDDRAVLERRHAEISEFRDFAAGGGHLSLAPAQPIDEALRAAAIAGTVLAYDDMLAVYRTAKVGQHVRERLSGLDEGSSLRAVGATIADLGPLIAQIETVFDEDGEVRDSASPQLASLRRKKRTLRGGVLEALERLVKDDKLDGVLRDRLVTQRGGRFVVPVRAGRRGAIPGVVHDSSSSGQTLYVEPLASVDQQNALTEADRAERQEVQRLLAELTAHVRAAIGALAAVQAAIGILDGRQAISRFAELIDAATPVFSDAGLSVRGARHPLMAAVSALAARGLGDSEAAVEPVPLDLEIPAGISALVITGPNTGGKTVALKTIALMTAMAQCGLPVPAVSASLPLSPRIHADIGDEQSIVANLSTFSAHLTRINRFLGDCPPGSLVLLDELGTGTDPAEGAALGIALLERLGELRALTLASTHHDALKAFAHSAEGALNAAMEFNSETLAPTYRLRVGLPGRSNAFDIAERLGLDATMVARARGLIDGDTAELDSLIRSVEDESEALAADRQGIQRQQGELAEVHTRYETLNRELIELRRTLAEDGKHAVGDAVAALRAEGDRQLEALAAELDETRKARSAQDRRARWAARTSGVEGAARDKIQEAVNAAGGLVENVVLTSGGGDVDATSAADIVEVEEDKGGALERGSSVVVMPLNLRGQIARDWAVGDDEAEVEVDVHGKRLIVSRRQVRRSGA